MDRHVRELMWKDKRLLKMGLVPQEIVTFEKYHSV